MDRREKGAAPMMKMELTNEEQEALRQVLQNSVATLELEIQHTDHQEFKGLLRQRRELLKKLLGRVTSSG
jgi:hypothetical protein